jgi:hypothetical protein
LDKEAFEAVKGFVARLKKHYRIERAIFFGSRARDDYFEHSDIDLLLVSPDFEGVFFTDRSVEVYLHWDYRNSKYGLEVLCYTPREFARKSKQICIVSEAIANGIEIEV